VDSYREEVGEFSAVAAPKPVATGPMEAALRVETSFGASHAVQEIALSPGSPVIRVRMTVDWHERHRVLKLCFPLRIAQPVATYEIPYGAIVREPNGNEEPGQRWIDVSGKAESRGRPADYGCSLLNDGKYGFDVLGSEMRMTVLRSPIYCFHDPAKVDPRRQYEYTDQGVQTLRYALVPHAGGWQDAGTVRRAQELNIPLTVKEEPAHPGVLPRAYSLVEVGADGVIVEVVKPSEDGGDIILRAYETHGSSVRAPIAFAGRPLGEFSFGASEIKTLRLSRRGKTWRAREVDMLERDL
jgi:alpha-mannosidase